MRLEVAGSIPALPSKNNKVTMEKYKCSRCGDEPSVYHGYGDKDGNPLCDSCVIKILEVCVEGAEAKKPNAEWGS